MNVSEMHLSFLIISEKCGSNDDGLYWWFKQTPTQPLICLPCDIGSTTWIDDLDGPFCPYVTSDAVPEVSRLVPFFRSSCYNKCLLLMVQESVVHQLRLVAYPIIYNKVDISQVVVWDFWTINSIFLRGNMCVRPNAGLIHGRGCRWNLFVIKKHFSPISLVCWPIVMTVAFTLPETNIALARKPF